MSERLSEQIAAFREAIVSWRRCGVKIEPDVCVIFDELFEGWERAARQLEREPDAARAIEDITAELEALSELTRKINSYSARLKALSNNHLKVV